MEISNKQNNSTADPVSAVTGSSHLFELWQHLADMFPPFLRTPGGKSILL